MLTKYAYARRVIHLLLENYCFLDLLMRNALFVFADKFLKIFQRSFAN